MGPFKALHAMSAVNKLKPSHAVVIRRGGLLAEMQLAAADARCTAPKRLPPGMLRSSNVDVAGATEGGQLGGQALIGNWQIEFTVQD